MAKVRYRLLFTQNGEVTTKPDPKHGYEPLLDAKTDAQLAELDVEVKGKVYVTRKRIFKNVEQLGGLADEDLLKMVNYAEDLFVRAKCTSDNTDATGKKAKRDAAREHWKLNDKPGFIQFFVEESHTTAEMDAKLDAYHAEHLAE